ncbi:DUF5999 family protein [Streptomyces scopuliridis]|uniref:DUF5999 family protein n=1 Tax=Streptomyces scopuliridis TaxID=452529 RepID=UPI0036CBC480
MFDDRRQAATTIDRVWRRPPQLIRCEAFATLDSPDRQSAIIRTLFWLSRVTVSGPEAAVAWAIDRLERFAQFLDGADIGRAARWTGDEEARWRALPALRTGKRLSFEVVDRDGVHYQAVIYPVRERPYARPHAPPHGGRRSATAWPIPPRSSAPRPPTADPVPPERLRTVPSQLHSRSRGAVFTYASTLRGRTHVLARSPCHAAEAPDREAARGVTRDDVLGWGLLCNGVVLFDDTGVLLPDGKIVVPHRPAIGAAA